MQNLAPHLPPDTQGQMLTISRFEERVSAGYLAGKIWGAVRCCLGERRSPPASVPRSTAATV